VTHGRHFGYRLHCLKEAMPVRRPPRCNVSVEAVGCLDHDTPSLLRAHVLRAALPSAAGSASRHYMIDHYFVENNRPPTA
jgi:hypothetical protein